MVIKMAIEAVWLELVFWLARSIVIAVAGYYAIRLLATVYSRLFSIKPIAYTNAAENVAGVGGLLYISGVIFSLGITPPLDFMAVIRQVGVVLMFTPILLAKALQ